MSQMFADQGGQSVPEGHLPRAPLRSHAEYIEFTSAGGISLTDLELPTLEVGSAMQQSLLHCLHFRRS